MLSVKGMAELQPPEGQINGGALVVSSAENVGSKRQRRPSVRLGDIGDQTVALSYDARRSKQWHDYKHRKEPGASAAGKGSRTRPLMNLGGAGGVGGLGGGEFHETLESEEKEGNLDGIAIGGWKMKDSKSRRGPPKRVRSSWVSKVGGVGGGGGDGRFSGGEDVEDVFREFEPEGSESLLKEHSQSSDRGQRRSFRTRVSEGRDQELEGPSDTDARDWKRGASVDMNGDGGRGRCQSSEDGVRIWLDGLGLGRYAPVFEIHEVDDEVLPMLTLEDLKDMGINAVGSRRKMFCAIEKLGKGFS